MPIINMLQTARKVHLMGIGGIGVSALARWLVSLNKKISGCNSEKSNITDYFEKKGIKISFSHNKSHASIYNPDLVIATSAIPETNQEVIEFRKRKIPLLYYPEALGLITGDLETTAICGANGKSTTTALIGLIAKDNKISPTFLVGSIVKEINSNFYKGSSNIVIIEACEYKRAFLQYHPKNLVITNIEPEHLDYYKDLNDIIKAFTQLALQINKNGALIINGDDKNIEKICKIIIKQRPDIKIIKFGKSKDCHVRFFDDKFVNHQTFFKVKIYNGKTETVESKIPGEFNIYNACAAIATAHHLQIPIKISKKVLSSFKGLWRRFENVGTYKKAVVISDYAHHPTAVSKTINASKSYFTNKQIFAIFEPHQHNRTRMLFDEFVKSFDDADKVLISEIYSVKGRVSKEDNKISSLDLVRAIEKRDKQRSKKRIILFGKNLNETLKLIKKHAQPNDCLLIMGAGDIGKIPAKLVKSSL